MLTLHWAAVRNRYAPICIVRSGVLSRGKPILLAGKLIVAGRQPIRTERDIL